MEQSLPWHLQQVLTVPSNTDEPPLFGLQSLLGKLEVFLHKSICCILKLSMFWVINKKLRNEQVRTSLFAMPCVKNMIAARQLDYSGKLIRGPHDQPARRMITSCCNETQRVGRIQRTEKNCIVTNLRLLFKDVPLKRIDHYGSLKHWIHEASNEQYWNQKIKRLTHPETPFPERSEVWGPLPSWQAQHANTTNEDESDNSDDEDEHDNNQDNAESRESIPPRQPPPRYQPPPPSQPAKQIYDPKLWLNNPEMCEMIGHSLGDLYKSLT